MALPSSRSSSADWISASGTTRVMSSPVGNDARADELDRRLEVRPLVDAGTDDRQLSPEDPLEVYGRGSGWMATTTIVPLTLARAVDGCDGRGGTGDLEDHVCSGARRSTRRATTESFAASGAKGGEAELRGQGSACGVELDHRHVATEVSGDGGDEESDRSAAEDDDLVAGVDLAPPYVVDGDRDGLDQRSVAEVRSSVASGPTVEAGTFHSGCNAPGESMPMKVRFWQMCVLPARQAGQVPSQSSGITVTFSPGDQPSTPSPTDVDRAAHLVTEDQRRVHATVHGPVNDVQVGAAQPHVGDTDADVTGWRGDRRHLVEVDRPVADVRGAQHSETSGLGFVSIWLRRLLRRCLKRHTYDLLRSARDD